MSHLQSHILNPELKSDNTLYVIGVISNPVRFHSRYRLARAWLEEMRRTPNVSVHMVEACYGDRLPEVAHTEKDLAVKVDSEIWIKENLINLGIRHCLPSDWKYVAWVDCDVSFRDPGWALATIHQLQHYNIVQPWQSATDLDFHGNVMSTWTSFGALCASGKPMCHDKTKQHLGYHYAHTGYAWACTRYFYENVGKLTDFNIVGAGDHLMAWACLNKVDATMPTQISPGYKSMCDDWEAKAFHACAGSVGFTTGRLEHNWHGSKGKRKYWSRWDILTKNDFDPKKDLAYDSQGVVVLVGKNKYKIEREIMQYNRSRCEDDLHD